MHSPFVYDLVTKCFYDRTKYPEYEALETYRSELLKNSTKITITDFGSGSKVFKSNERALNAIAKTSGTSLKNSKLLFRIVRHFESAVILELGTNLGIAAQAMSLANPKSKITTIEGCPSILDIAKQQLFKKNRTNITFFNGDFNTEITKLTQKHWDLIFFDGHHSKEATLNYFEMLLHTAHNDSVFIFDDIYWSKGMTEAWETIKNHPQVTVTIDTFNWGLVLFRKEQAKQHFKIRV